MKRTLLTLMAVMSMLPMAAQDTVPVVSMPITLPENYGENRWMQADPMDSNLYVRKYVTQILEQTFGYKLESTLRVVGMACLVDTGWYAALSAPDSINMAIRVPEYMCLYERKGDSMILKKKVCYTDKSPKCRVKLRALWPDSSIPIGWQTPSLYEVYYDDTVTINDTIVFGLTFYNNCIRPNGLRPIATAFYGARWRGHEADSLSQWCLRERSGVSFWTFQGKAIASVGIFPIFDTTDISPDTSVSDTTIVDTTRISSVVEQFTYLFPNPASGHATIYSSFPMRSVAVYDPTGRCVMRRRVDATMVQIELSGYERGLYYVEVQTGAGRTVKRLLVN